MAVVLVMAAFAVQADQELDYDQLSNDVAKIGAIAISRLTAEEERFALFVDLALAVDRKGGGEDVERLFSYALANIPAMYSPGNVACATIRGADKAVGAGRGEFARTALAKAAETLDDKLHADDPTNPYSHVGSIADVALWRHWLGDEDGFDWTMDTARRLLERVKDKRSEANARIRLGMALAAAGRTDEARRSFAKARTLAESLGPEADERKPGPRLDALIYLVNAEHVSGLNDDAQKTLKFIRGLPEARDAHYRRTVAHLAGVLSRPPPPPAVPPEDRLKRTCP